MKQDLHWFAVYTNFKAEKKVAERLKEAGFEVYLPLMTTMRQWSDRKKKVKVPLINSYVFVRSTFEGLRPSVRIQGVVGVLKHLGKPAIIRDYEIENMKILLREGDGLEGIHSNLSEQIKPGEPVEITAGPLAGLKAEFVEFQGKSTVIARVQALNSYMRVHVSPEFIREKV